MGKFCYSMRYSPDFALRSGKGFKFCQPKSESAFWDKTLRLAAQAHSSFKTVSSTARQQLSSHLHLLPVKRKVQPVLPLTTLSSIVSPLLSRTTWEMSYSLAVWERSIHTLSATLILRPVTVLIAQGLCSTLHVIPP